MCCLRAHLLIRGFPGGVPSDVERLKAKHRAHSVRFVHRHAAETKIGVRKEGNRGEEKGGGRRVGGRGSVVGVGKSCSKGCQQKISFSSTKSAPRYIIYLV